MTKKEIDELANKVANAVIEAMEKKQDEFDREFAKSIEFQDWSIETLK